MKKKLLRSLAVTLGCSLFAAGSAYALPTLDYYTGVAADSVYSDTGAEYVNLTDPTDPASAVHSLSLESILSTYNHDYKIGMFDVQGGTTYTLDVLDTFLGVTTNNVVFDLGAGTATESANGASSTIDSNFGYFLQFYTNIGGGVLSSESYYSDITVGGTGGDQFGFFYDAAGIASLGYAETAMSLGGPTTQGHAVIGIHDVSPVPEPATMFLFGTGLAGFAALRRRKSEA